MTEHEHRQPHHRASRLFQAGVALKGLQGLIEAAGGAVLLVADNAAVRHLIQVVTQVELNHNPREALAAYVLKLGQELSLGTQHFYALYFMAHGLVKLFLVAALLRDRPWSYPAALAMLSLFVLYQFVRLAGDWSWTLALLTGIDLVVIGLIYWQYRTERRERAPA